MGPGSRSLSDSRGVGVRGSELGSLRSVLALFVRSGSHITFRSASKVPTEAALPASRAGAAAQV